MKRYALAFIVSILASAAPAYAQFAPVGPSIGIAQYTNVSTSVEITLATAPTAGVARPVGTRSMTVCVQNFPLRYSFNATTAVTSTTGLIMNAGNCYYLDNKPALIKAFRAIGDSSGSPTLFIEYFGNGTD